MVAKVFTTTFAENGDKTPIPEPTQPGGEVSYNIGFGPDYARQLGVDPLAKNISRANFNAALGDITVSLREMQSGVGAPAFDAALAAALPGGGYAKGAVIPRADGNGYWQSTVADNATDPATGGSWFPVDVYGAFTQALSNVNVTPSVTNAAYPLIILTGILTANVQLILPAWAGYNWTVDNRCTGAFTVTVKTAAGTGVVIANGVNTAITSDGVNIEHVDTRLLTQLDTTSGALMPLGSWGLGGAAVSAELNLNNYVRGGKFITPAAGMSNFPSGTILPAGQSVCTLEVTGGQTLAGVLTYTTQLLTVVGTASLDVGKQASRVYDGVSWSAWKLVGSGGGQGAVGGSTDKVFVENSLSINFDYVIGQASQNPATISIASPGVVTQANDFVAGQEVFFMTTGALPTGLAANTVYYVVASGLTPTTYSVSATLGGAAINTSGVQSGAHTAGLAKNANTAGDIRVAPGATVTVPVGSSWSIT